MEETNCAWPNDEEEKKLKEAIQKQDKDEDNGTCVEEGAGK